MTWILVLAALYLLIVFALWLWQDRFMYFPGPPAGSPPPIAGLESREDWIETPDGERLHAWRVRPGERSDRLGAVLVCHGNGGNIANRQPAAETFAAMEYEVLLLEYRGYGASSGKPGEEGTYVDAVAAYDRLASDPRIDPDRIFAYGESLGGAVAIELSRRRRLKAVVVESTFTSMPDIGAAVYPWLPIRLLARAQYDSIAKVPELGVPLLVIHSPEDDLIPFEHGRRLFEAAREPKRFLATTGRHNDWGFLQTVEWRSLVRDFLARGD
ncbi:MAG: alpha/beta hydrolase [Planctomycetota bacterium]